jgi:hypothetical protein
MYVAFREAFGVRFAIYLVVENVLDQLTASRGRTEGGR